ncbi:FadR/GntR family transcriptional regulator [Blastococcus sp. SYSU D00820]
MAFEVEPVLRPREQVEKQLRSAIVSSTFKRGERLPSEAELAKTFQVSRATIREALRALASEGLISKHAGPAGGSFVETVDHESLRGVLSGSLETILSLGRITFAEVMAVRQMLEIPAARLAAENRTDEQLAELQRLIERQQDLQGQGAFETQDPEIFELGTSIYSLVAAASGNRVLASFVAALGQVTRPIFQRELRPEDASGTTERTRALISAIAAQDPDAAERSMAAQLDLSQFDAEVLGEVATPARGVA